MKPNHVLLVVMLITAVIFTSGCYFLSDFSQMSSLQSAPSPGTAPVQCADPPCFSQHFLACEPSELRMPFMEGTTYVITVFGLESGSCHYASKIVDLDGNLVPGMQVTDCTVPLEKITTDTLGHFFGSDKEPSKETVKAQQDQIELDYCSKQ